MSYGVQVREGEKAIGTISSIPLDKKRVTDFVARCNREERFVFPILDVIEDEFFCGVRYKRELEKRNL